MHVNFSMKRQLVFIGLGYKTAVLFLLFAAAHLPSFDQSSPHVYSRWDTIHYQSIAQRGYVFEHQWAFFPGIPFIISLLPSQLASGILVGLITIPTITTLYDLSLVTLKDPSLAYVSTLLSIFTSSPATLHIAGYAEPLFTFCVYRGLLDCSRRCWFASALFFMVASSLRSNGILLTGFLMWHLVAHPLLSHGKIVFRDAMTCVATVTMVFVPFVAHNYSAWSKFCTEDSKKHPPWCNQRLPLIYSYVQSKYWNVGFLRYWTLTQVPNFLISLPIILLLLWSSSTLLWHQRSVFKKNRPSSTTQKLHVQNFFTIDLLPHAIHASLLTLWISFAAHAQILLRLAPSMPFVYWSATRLLAEHPHCGKYWIYWCVTWGTASIILWAAFLPPA